MEFNRRYWHDPGFWKKKTKKSGLVYGISYMHGGKRIRETVGPYLTEARQALEDRRSDSRNDRLQKQEPQLVKTFNDLPTNTSRRTPTGNGPCAVMNR